MATGGIQRLPPIDPATGMPSGFVPHPDMFDPNDLTPHFSIQEMTGGRPGIMPGAPIIPGMPGLPAYPGIVGVNELFSPTFGRNETITRGAENAVGGGFAGSGFGGAQTNRLLDSERKENFLLGHQILEPYLNREFEAGQGAANRQGRLNEIAAEGANALQRLQLSEAGQGARLSTELEARLRQQVLEGEQAIQRLTLQEAGESSRQRTGIGGTLANTLLQGLLSGKGGGSEGPTRYGTGNLSGPIGSTFYGSPGTGLGAVQPGSSFSPLTSRTPTSTGSSSVPGVGSFGLGSSSVDSLLRKYGLLN